MPFSPDIVVTSSDARILLIAEAKRRSDILREDESQLKFYMTQMRCPIGLLVTPDEIEVFRDRYTSISEASVERVGILPAPSAWEIFRVPHHGAPKDTGDRQLAFRFEDTVRNWLEQVAASPSAYLNELPEESRDVVADYVLPALTEGIVRSSGPRESFTSH